ncbi:TerD family protein [Streptomyces sp. 4N509B]|uniref:TerD family protein n=1 Tax=Streptomyces sp. 4N509B TaxID=3457413 RepID=UPI003FD5E152
MRTTRGAAQGGETTVSVPSKGIEKVEVGLRWDASPMGHAPVDLDIIAGTFRADDPQGAPAYLVHHDSRSPDGTITLTRESGTGQGFGYDEVMVLELGRLAPEYGRVVVGVAIQQRSGPTAFGDVRGAEYRVAEGYTELLKGDFAAVATCTAATVGEFVRDGLGLWQFRPGMRGFEDTGPTAFAALFGRDPL